MVECLYGVALLDALEMQAVLSTSRHLTIMIIMLDAMGKNIAIGQNRKGETHIVHMYTLSPAG